MQFPEAYRREGKSCLFVGKGPSAAHAKDHLLFGDLATVNDAALLFSHVDFSFWTDFLSAEIVAEINTRRPIFVLPDKMHQETWLTSLVGRWHVIKTPMDVFPPDRTILYPYNHVLAEREPILHAMKQDKAPMCSTAVVGLYVLAAQFRYRRILCYGFDGGRGYVQGVKFMEPATDYTAFRRAMEVVAEYVSERYGTIIEWGS